MPDLARLRLSSIDSIEADPLLIELIAGERRLMPHLHLSLQAGSDIILKRMKRRHLTADAEAFTAAVRAKRSDIIFGADIIAGFPTETEEDAAATLAHLARCGITHLHVFPFSPRRGTPAARMPQLPAAVIKTRAAALRAFGASQLEAHLGRQTGRIVRVLTERGGIGRTEDFTPVALPAAMPHGVIMDMRITGHDGRRLLGEAVNAMQQAAE